MPKQDQLRLPPWIKKTLHFGSIHEIKKQLRSMKLATVCEEACCPNIKECFSKPTATFLILGKICTRNCGFCAVKKGVPEPVDPMELVKVARQVQEMKLAHAVITSVTRDDLPDGGAAHFRQVILEIRNLIPGSTIEVLVPDFNGNHASLEIIKDADPDVFNHNVETVPRLYSSIRPQADFQRSIQVLLSAAKQMPGTLVKSGFMVGLGETDQEVFDLIGELAEAGVEAITIGQYLRPRMDNFPVQRYVEPEIFEMYAAEAHRLGFKYVASAPLVRSSYFAESAIKQVKNQKEHLID